MCVHYVCCAWCLNQSKEGIGSPGTVAKDFVSDCVGARNQTQDLSGRATNTLNY